MNKNSKWRRRNKELNATCVPAFAQYALAHCALAHLASPHCALAHRPLAHRALPHRAFIIEYNVAHHSSRFGHRMVPSRMLPQRTTHFTSNLNASLGSSITILRNISVNRRCSRSCHPDLCLHTSFKVFKNIPWSPRERSDCHADYFHVAYQ